MRDKIISVTFMALALLIGNNLHAATYCGPASSSSIKYSDGQDRYCMDSGGLTLTAPASAAEVCITYASMNSYQYINCSINSIKCSSYNYYSGSGSSATCPTCQTGKCASTGANHQNASCSYCASNYYYGSGNCNACPESGKTDEGCSYSTVLTSCYLAANSTGNDATGDYTITSKCYHSGTL